MQGTNKFLKVWYLFYRWTSLWKAHRIGIRVGNYDMQYTILAAFAPLFPVAGKNRYSQSVVHFLSRLAKLPRLQILLKTFCSVNLTKGHYLAFDEALEIYGVKFIKQYISGLIIDNDNLAKKIASAQAENDRIKMLYCAFADDPIMTKNEQAINNRKDALWNLINKLVVLFDSTNPEDDITFKYCPQLNELGYNSLFECYEKGNQQLLSIFRQEILHTESINTKGRTAKNVVVTKVADLKKMISKDKKSKKEHSNELHGESSNSNQNTSFISESLLHTQNISNTSNLSFQ